MVQAIIVVPPPATPTHGYTVDIRYSKDGRRWSNWKTRNLGDMGAHIAKATVRRLGKGEQWYLDVRVTDPVRADLLAASVQIEGEA